VMHGYLVDGQGTAKDVMDQIAKEHRQILVEEGVLK
jgi:hypothetical protein